MRLWQKLAICGLALLEVWRWLKWLLGWGEHIEFVTHHGPSGFRAVSNFLLNPPPSFSFALFVLALALFLFWERHRWLHYLPAFSTGSAKTWAAQPDRLVEGSLLEPQFDPLRDIYRNVDLFNVMGQQLPNKATYVQIQVASLAHVDDCCGWLTEIVRLDAAGKPVASLPIGGSRSFKWSPQEQNRISVPIDPHIPQGLDIFRVIENVNRIELMVAGGYPPAWITFLNVPAVYRMAIAVTGKETKPRSIKLRVDWKGQWNDFDVGLG